MASLKIFARSAADLIPRTRQVVGAKQTLITVFFTAKKPLMFDVFPRSSTFNQSYFINDIFPDLKTANLSFRHQKIELTFRVCMDNFNCHDRSKVMSKIQRSHISRMPHPQYSPNISSCDFWLFGMSEQILRDREFSLSDETEDAIAQIWNDLPFDDVQSVSRDWIWHLAWVTENDGEYMSESNKIRFLMSTAY
jgi:hypothetical protein